MNSIQWKFKPFKELTVQELYATLKLRVDVFVVEQKCAYPELDNKDCHPETLHMTGTNRDNELCCYLRILAPGVSFDQVAIGRVVTHREYRSQGLSREMMTGALKKADKCWPGAGITISAQSYLDKFYGSLGFKQISKPYFEDGIEHINMFLTRT